MLNELSSIFRKNKEKHSMQITSNASNHLLPAYSLEIYKHLNDSHNGMFIH
ncbi:hypothetical protein [Neobacillus drentensis]|uniref:hypothetical protein n=1 Tax=Neobacillus drentensis TaxID=220684 RepID=UPI002FFF3E81